MPQSCNIAKNDHFSTQALQQLCVFTQHMLFLFDSKILIFMFQNNYDELSDNSTEPNMTDTFHIDELSLTIRQEQNEEILLNCPFCSMMLNLSDVGKHFEAVHKLSRFICPGSKCPNRIKVKNIVFAQAYLTVLSSREEAYPL